MTGTVRVRTWDEEWAPGGVPEHADRDLAPGDTLALGSWRVEVVTVHAVGDAAAEVASWHQPPARGHAKGTGLRARPRCTECAFPWPCRTYTRLSGGQP